MNYKSVLVEQFYKDRGYRVVPEDNFGFYDLYYIDGSVEIFVEAYPNFNEAINKGYSLYNLLKKQEISL